MKTIKLPYIPVSKYETVLEAKDVIIDDMGSYLRFQFWAKVETEEEDEDMGMKNKVKRFFDNKWLIPKDKIDYVDVFFCNSIKKYCSSVSYGSSGLTIAFPDKASAEKISEELIQMIFTK